MKNLLDLAHTESGVLNLHIEIHRQEYIKNVNTEGTLENKLYNKYRHMTIIEFLHKVKP